MFGVCMCAGRDNHHLNVCECFIKRGCTFIRSGEHSLPPCSAAPSAAPNQPAKLPAAGGSITTSRDSGFALPCVACGPFRPVIASTPPGRIPGFATRTVTALHATVPTATRWFTELHSEGELVADGESLECNSSLGCPRSAVPPWNRGNIPAQQHREPLARRKARTGRAFSRTD